MFTEKSKIQILNKWSNICFRRTYAFRTYAFLNTLGIDKVTKVVKRDQERAQSKI